MKFIVIWCQDYDMCFIVDIISENNLEEYIKYDKEKYIIDNPGQKIIKEIRRKNSICYEVNMGEKYNIENTGGFNFDILELDRFKK